MEENENKEDVIYDLESSVSGEESADDNNSANSENSENADNADNADNVENPSDNPAMVEIGRMVEEMGADTLLDIIRDNRNAAIRQIIKEVEATRPPGIPSGSSPLKTCTSIFDLAALA